MSRPRPPLENLSLSIPEDDDVELDGPVFSTVLQTLNSFSDSLKTLSLDLMGKKLASGFPQRFLLPGVRLKKLEHMILWQCEKVRSMILLMDAPIKRLRMGYPNPYPGGCFDWRALGHYGSTLEELDVCGVGRGMEEYDYYELSINLPNLRIIKLEDIKLQTLEHLFNLSSLKKLNSFYADFGYNSLEESARGFALVEQKLNENPTVWELFPSLQEFSVVGETRDEDDENPRARREKVVTCVRGKPVQIILKGRRY